MNIIHGRRERGMVTTEIALGSLVIATLLGVVVSVAAILVTIDRCELAANAIAREVARGDTEAVEHLASAVPASATAMVTHSGRATTVVVRYDAVWAGIRVTSFDATATVLDEARP